MHLLLENILRWPTRSSLHKNPAEEKQQRRKSPKQATSLSPSCRRCSLTKRVRKYPGFSFYMRGTDQAVSKTMNTIGVFETRRTIRVVHKSQSVANNLGYN